VCVVVNSRRGLVRVFRRCRLVVVMMSVHGFLDEIGYPDIR